jgi:hypothetical protein
MALRLIQTQELQRRQALLRERVIPDRTNPIEVYTDAQLLSRVRFDRQGLIFLSNILNISMQYCYLKQLGSLDSTLLKSLFRFLLSFSSEYVFVLYFPTSYL